MFTSRINKNNDKLTYSDQLIANLLIEHYCENENSEVITSDEVARRVGCGQATVIRFSQKLGYPTYKSMIMDILNDSVLKGNNKLQQEESIHSIMNKLQNLYTTSVRDVMTYNSGEDIDRAVKMFEESNTIFCYGVRSSNASVSLMYYRLMDIGKKVFTAQSKYEAMSIVRNLDENDVMLVVSNSGETEEALNTVKVAKSRNVKVISITGSMENSIQKMSDVALKSAEYNIHTNRFNMINRASELFLIDCIFIRYWRNNEEELMQSSEAFANEMEEEYPASGQVEGFYRL